LSVDYIRRFAWFYITKPALWLNSKNQASHEHVNIHYPATEAWVFLCSMEYSFIWEFPSRRNKREEGRESTFESAPDGDKYSTLRG
jgi:hypothetical protein